MAAGLAAMVAGMSRGKKAYIQYEAQHSEALARLATLREELKAAIDADSEAYKGVVAAFKAARDNPAAQPHVNAATRTATLVPLSVAEKSREVATIVEQLSRAGCARNGWRTGTRPGRRSRSRRAASGAASTSGTKSRGGSTARACSPLTSCTSKDVTILSTMSSWTAKGSSSLRS